MTYMDFHLIFTIPLFLFLFCAVFVFRRDSLKVKHLVSLCLLSLIAFSYTTPWDNFLVYKEVWTYLPGSVLGTWGYVPYEEYFFFLIQTLIGSLCVLLFSKETTIELSPKFTSVQIFCLATICLIWLTCLIGLYYDSTFYLSLILVWAIPPIAIQWIFGWALLKSQWRLTVSCIGALSIYFWICDAIALINNTWLISSKYITGIYFGVLPLEEALFFLVTNVLVVQGYVLFTHKQLSQVGSQWTFRSLVTK